ncbi:hypothetical protein [Reyranella sp.]
MGTFVWQWPQITWAVWACVVVLVAVAMDGEPKTGKFNGTAALIALFVSATLLYFGGFFTEVRP